MAGIIGISADDPGLRVACTAHKAWCVVRQPGYPRRPVPLPRRTPCLPGNRPCPQGGTAVCAGQDGRVAGQGGRVPQVGRSAAVPGAPAPAAEWHGRSRS